MINKTTLILIATALALISCDKVAEIPLQDSEASAHYEAPEYYGDLILNFEESCFFTYGEQAREEIIDDALETWNSIPGTPRRFQRGEDIAFEIDVDNYRDHTWDAARAPDGYLVPFLIAGPVTRQYNPIICDETGEITEELYGDRFAVTVHGAAGKYVKGFYDFFNVVINESVFKFETPDTDDDFQYNQMTLTNLLAHELGHILGIGHLPKNEDGSYPLMHSKNLRRTLGISFEDYEAHREKIKANYSGVSTNNTSVSFEAEVFNADEHLHDDSGKLSLVLDEYTSVKLIINVPVEHRGKNAEILVAAGIENPAGSTDSHQWFFYSDKNWTAWSEGDTFSGTQKKLRHTEYVEVFRGNYPLNAELTFLWGYVVDGELYFNDQLPTVLVPAISK